MTICAPNPVPSELGMIAVRVLVPELQVEIDYAAARPELSLWRITVWEHGTAWFGLYQGEELLKPEGFAFFRRAYPARWVELNRPAAPKP